MFKYLNLSRMLRQIVEEGHQLKTVIYQSTSLKKTEIPASYSLLSLVLNNYNELHEAQERIASKSKLEISNKYLLMVMMAEYINKGKIVGGGKVKRALVDNLDLMPNINKQSKINKQKVQVRLRENQEEFNKMEQLMKERGEADRFVPNLYNLEYTVYSELTKDQQIKLLESDVCVMQSYSSCLPPFLLLQGVKQKWINRKYDVMDACSAPGNKTIQLAEYLGSNGRVFAFEKNIKRYELLQNTLSKYHASNVKPKNQDFLQVTPCSKYKKVKFIMLDPSCSGSGMLTNFARDSHQKEQQQEQEASFEKFCQKRFDQLSEKQKERVENLHTFQVELLKHAASFKPVRLSYSTCSIYRRENEDVVSEFLQENKGYTLKKVKITHPNSHKGFGEGFQNCVRIDPRGMDTDGFFVAIFCLRKSTS